MTKNAVSIPQGLAAFAYGEAVFNERRIVDALVKDVGPRVAARQKRGGLSPTETLFIELFQRVRLWVDSLGRLESAYDFQAVTAGARALFEITVDLTLLRFAKGKYTPEKMLAWEDSAKLKHAKGVERHFQKRMTPAPMAHAELMMFIQKAERSIVAARKTYFQPDDKGKWRHPPRWTEWDLATDAGIAEAATPSTAAWSIDLEELYATFHARMCWTTHGSSVVALRFLPEKEIPLLGAEAMSASLSLAERCAWLLVQELGMYGAEVRAAFEKCRVERRAMLTTVLKHHAPEAFQR